MYQGRTAAYLRDSLWATRFDEQLIAIIKEQASHIIQVRRATEKEDNSCEADLVLETSSGKILCRTRSAKYYRRDLTIRCERPTGTVTELQKIESGAGRWYLYAWTNDNRITEWMLIDLDRLRQSGLIERWRRNIFSNPDKTKFIAIPRSEIHKAGAIVSERRLPEK